MCGIPIFTWRHANSEIMTHTWWPQFLEIDHYSSRVAVSHAFASFIRLYVLIFKSPNGIVWDTDVHMAPCELRNYDSRMVTVISRN